MEFSYSDEQGALRELAARLFAARFSDQQRKDFVRSRQPLDDDLWRSLAAAGLLGTAVAAPLGAGLGLIELGILLEEQGRTLAAVPLLATLVQGALPLARFGNDAQRALLKDLVAGELLMSAALEEGPGSDPLQPHTLATAEEAGWRLRGEKLCVPYGAQAQLLLIPARTERGARLFLIDPRTAGIELEACASTSGEPQARITLREARVPQQAALGEVADEAIRWTLERAWVAYGALQLGVLTEALRRAALYVSERQQFGRPIGSFQAVQHRLADCYIDLEALRSVYLRAAWALDAGVASCAEVLAVKWWAARAGHRVSHAVQHVHGGLGADLEYPIHAYFLHATQYGLALGGSEPALERIGAELAAGRVPGFT
jgi:3-oxocholest-4-en-26-oyl-CoA dehydrogenase beta subunit